VFAWCSFIPAIKYGIKGISFSLVVISVLIVPYMLILNSLVGGQILHIAIWMAVIAVVFMWVVFVVFKMLKTRKLVASAISLLLAVPASILVNLVLSRTINVPMFDVWDAMSFIIIAIVVSLLFYLDYGKTKEKAPWINL